MADSGQLLELKIVDPNGGAKLVRLAPGEVLQLNPGEQVDVSAIEGAELHRVGDNLVIRTDSQVLELGRYFDVSATVLPFNYLDDQQLNTLDPQAPLPTRSTAPRSFDPAFEHSFEDPTEREDTAQFLEQTDGGTSPIFSGSNDGDDDTPRFAQTDPRASDNLPDALNAAEPTISSRIDKADNFLPEEASETAVSVVARLQATVKELFMKVIQETKTRVTTQGTDTQTNDETVKTRDDAPAAPPPVNQAPTGADGSVTTHEDVAYTFTTNDFTFSDAEGASLASIKVTDLPDHGSLQLYQSGSWSNLSINQIITANLVNAGQLRFVPGDDDNGNAYDSFKFQVSDGTQFSSSSYTLTIDVAAINDAATLAQWQSSRTFDENTINAAAAVIDSAVLFDDIDSSNLSGGNLTITYSSGGGAEDQLSVNNAGNGAGQIGVSGTTVSYEGTAMGTITTNGANGDDLIITFNSNATVTAVDALLQHITYQNTSDNPTASRTISVTIDDGDGDVSAPQTTTIVVSAENDAPVMDNTGSMALTAVYQNIANSVNNGTAVSAIITSAGGDRITDVDNGASEGIAITGVDANGTWQYQVSGGSWINVGAVSDNSALLLKDTASLRYIPDDNSITAGSITFRAWDQTSGSEATKVDVSTNGNGTAFSGDTETASITINGLILTAGNDIFTTRDVASTFQTADANFSAGDTLSASVAVDGDTLQFTDAATITSAELANKTGLDVIQFDGNSTLTLDGVDGANFVAAAFNDQLEVNNQANTLTLDTSAVDSGDDVIIAGTGQVTLSDNGNRVVAKDGVNTNIDGGAGADTIVGGTGNDNMSGGDGADVLTGNAGSDTFIWTSASNTGTVDGTDMDLVTDFVSGTDTLDIDGILAGGAIYIGQDSNLALGITNFAFNQTGGNTFVNMDYDGDGTTDAIIKLTGNINLLKTDINFTDAAAQTGTTGADTLTSASAGDHLTGLAGNDVLTGNTGAEIIIGGSGDDTIAGLAGADKLYGGAGTDTLSYAADSTGVTVDIGNNTASGGDAANDTISGFENLIGGSAADTLTGSAGANSISGGDGNDVIEGGAGADVLDGGGGTDTLSYAGDSTGVTINLSTNSASGGDAASDTISNFENVTGGSAADNITGDANANVLTGNAGNDVIDGGRGTDVISGGDGADTLIGGYGADTISGGDGDDVIYADNVAFTNSSIAGMQVWLDASDINADGSIVTDGSTVSTWHDKSGNDVDATSYTVGAQHASVDANGMGMRSSFSFNNNGYFKTVDFADGVQGQANTVISVFDVDGWTTTNYIYDGNDTTHRHARIIQIDDQRADLYAGVQYQANAAYSGGIAIATDIYNTTNSIAYVNGTATTAAFNAGTKSLDGLTIGNYANGSNTSYTHEGGISEMIVFNSELTSTQRTLVEEYLSYKYATALSGLSFGADTLTGGAGSDTFTWTNASYTGTVDGTNMDLVTDFVSGTDTLDIAGILAGSAFYIGQGSNIAIGATNFTFSQSGGNTFVNMDYDGDGSADAMIKLTGNINLLKTDFNYTNAAAQTGTTGADTLTSASAGDHLTGLAGNDILTGNTGAEIIIGGLGDDTIAGLGGADRLYGGAGIDTLSYAADSTGVTVNISNNTASGGDATGDTISGFENVIGGSGADTITGDDNANTLIGNAGADIIAGGQGADVLSGGDGDDTLTGGNGADILTGGTGNDTFVWNDISHTGNTDGVDVDLVTDFVSGADTLDIDGILGGNAVFVGNGAPAAIGMANFGFTQTGGNTFIQMDYNGNGKIDGQIKLTGNIDLVNGDINYTDGADQTGTAGADTLTATDSGDVITGLGGNDTVTGGTGDDALLGGAGNDILIGGYGGDILSGGVGDDIIYADNLHFDSTFGGSNLQAWYDANDILGDSSRTDTSTVISTWHDKSGNTLDLTQTGGADYDDAYMSNGWTSGRGGVYFADDYFASSGDIDLSSGGSVFMMAQSDNTGNYNGLMSVRTAYNGTSYMETYFGNTDITTQFNRASDHSWQANDANMSNGTQFIFSELFQDNVAHDVSIDGANLSINSTSDDTDHTPSTASKLFLGFGYGSSESATYAFNGYMGEILIYDTVLTAAQTAAVEQYLSMKFGQALAGLSFGADTLTGGAGNDTFRWTNASHTGTGSGNRDVITDFTAGDQIDLDGLMGGDFVFLGTETLIGNNIASVNYAYSGSDTIIYLDYSGDGTADAEIELANVNYALDVHDFDFSNADSGVTGTANADRLVGTTGDDTITGDGGNDILHGGDGDDTIDGGAGIDFMYGGDGDDILLLDISDIDGTDNRYDGGAGDNDVLRFANGDDLDLTSVGQDEILNIEILDLLTDSTGNTVTLTLTDVLDISDSTNSLFIRGDSSDTVIASGGLSFDSNTTIDSVDYALYTGGGASLYIETNINESVS